MTSTDVNSRSDGIEVLIADHREVEGLFSAVESSAAAEREQVVADVIRALSVHAAVEEQVLYPAVRKQLPDGAQQADHPIEEHQEVKETIAELEKVGASAAEATQLLHNLMSSVRDHVREEENDMFPRLRASLSAKELEEMRDAVVKAKESAPTHPHPKAPSTPPGNIVAGAVARVVDKIRDTAGGSSEK